MPRGWRLSSPPGPSLRIMGVDPGLTATGFGIVEMERSGSLRYCGSGVLRARPGQPLAQKLQNIFQGLSREIKKFQPQLLAVESPFLAKNVKSAMLLGQARGTAILAAAQAGLEVREFSPLEIKRAVVGYGRAEKEQVQVMIRSLLQTRENLSTDAADALAAAVCLAHCQPWQDFLQTQVQGALASLPRRKSGRQGDGR